VILRLAGLPGGAEARIESLEARGNGHAIRLCSTVPFPPGARVEGALAEEPSVVVRLKVHSCRRIGEEDGAFEIAGRTLDLPRRVREEIERRLGGATRGE
jgi:hypothetical protein